MIEIVYDLYILQSLISFFLIIFLLVLFVLLVCVQNYIMFLILNEILVFCLMLLFLCFGFLFDDLLAQVFVLFLLILSSCEVVIAFSIIIGFKSNVGSLNVYKRYYNS